MRRHSLLLASLVVVGVAWIGPLPELAHRAFAAHMVVHMTIVAVAAPMIALWAAGGSLDPVRHMPGLFSPIPASLVEFVVVWAWHAPRLHDAARHNATVFMAEQGTFLLSGLFLWFSVFGGEKAHRRARRAAGLIALLLTSMHMTLLGALLALTPRPLYHQAMGLSALTPIQDQHLGGAIMLVVGGLSYLAAGLWIMAGLLRQQEAS